MLIFRFTKTREEERDIMKRLSSILLFVLAIILCGSFLHADTQTINTVPSGNSSFITNLQTFLKDEEAARAQKVLSRVVTGGIGATDATLTHTISAVTAYVEGYYVYDAAVSHTYTASKDTFVLIRYDDSATVTVGDAAITYDGNFVFAETANGTAEPNAPAGTLMLFEAVTNGTAITTVNDYRTGGTVFLSDVRFAGGANGRLYAADAAISTLPTTILVDVDDALGDDVTIASTVYLVPYGGIVTLNSHTLTFTSPENIRQNGQQLFSGSGVAFTNGGKLDPLLWGTTANTSLIQAAVDALPSSSSGSTIELTSKQYTMVMTGGYGVRIDKSDITFTSTCNTEFIHDGSDINGQWFAIGVDSAAATFVKVHDISFIGPMKFTGSASSTSTGQGAIYALPPSTNYDAQTDGSYNISVMGCYFRGFTYDIYLKGVYGVEVAHCNMGSNVFIPGAGAGGYGVLTESIWGAKIHDNTFISDTDDRHAVYISCDGDNTGTEINYYINISDNEMDWNNTVAGTNFYRHAISARSTSHFVASDNFIRGPMHNGISLSTEELNSDDYVIEGNHVVEVRNTTGTTGGCIGFVYDATYTFTGVTVADNTCSEASGSDDTYGYSLGGVENALLDNNYAQLVGTDSIGIYISNSSDITLQPNHLDGSGTARSGVGLAGTVNNVIFFKQHIENMTTESIEALSTPTLSNMRYMYPLRAEVAFDGIGGITVTDTDDWISSVVTDAVGCNVTVDEPFIIPANHAFFTYTNRDGNEDNHYYTHSNPSTSIFLIGIRTLAGAAKPAANNSNDFDIVFVPHY